MAQYGFRCPNYLHQTTHRPAQRIGIAAYRRWPNFPFARRFDGVHRKSASNKGAHRITIDR